MRCACELLVHELLPRKEKTHETCSQDAGPDAGLREHLHGGRSPQNSSSGVGPHSNVPPEESKLRLVEQFGKVTKVTLS